MSRITPAELKALLANLGEEVAFLDIREAGEYGMEHPFQVVNLPFSLLEARIHLQVPRRSTRLVLMDEQEEGRAQRGQRLLTRAGYSHVEILAGGLHGWKAAGFGVFAGVHVVSKTFGELVHETFHTPSIGAETLDQWQREGKSLHVVDGRPKDEYRKMNIPGATCCPNGELARRLPTMLAGDATSPVVVNCAGRTRSIIGAQTLVWLGIDNPVYALENGTQGWRLAGQELEHGSERCHPEEAELDAGLAEAARHLAREHGVAPIDTETFNRWQADSRRTTYLFDVRTAAEYRRATPPGAIHAPGGQLIQATDQWVGVQHARVVLIDDDECRAPVVAAWLKLMGVDATWLEGGAAHWSALRSAPMHSLSSTHAELPKVSLQHALSVRQRCLDVRPGMQYRAGHLPGARWVNRSLLEQQLAAMGAEEDEAFILVGDAERVACLVPELETLGVTRLAWLAEDADAWQAAGVELEVSLEDPDDASCIDYLFFVHDRHDGNLEAARRYLAWETGLLAQLDHQERQVFAI